LNLRLVLARLKCPVLSKVKIAACTVFLPPDKKDKGGVKTVHKYGHEKILAMGLKLRLKRLVLL